MPSNWVKFNVVGEDKIFGTLIAIRTIKSTLPGKENEDAKVYELKADYGSFHVLDDSKRLVEEPITIEANSVWCIGGKLVIDRQMQHSKIGQKVGFKFTDETPAKTKGFSAANLKMMMVLSS